MTSLTISGKKIEVLHTDGYEIWDGIVIKKAHRDKDGSWAGLRRSLITTALQRKVKWLNIWVQDCGVEFTVSPQEFKSKAKPIDMPSKFHGTFEILLYPISDLVVERSGELLAAN